MVDFDFAWGRLTRAPGWCLEGCALGVRPGAFAVTTGFRVTAGTCVILRADHVDALGGLRYVCINVLCE